MKLKLDLHVHTSKSPDSSTTPENLVEATLNRGLDGVAVTDHNVACTLTSDDIIVVPGIEVSSTSGHIVGLGENQAVPSGLPPESTVKLMKSLGYVVVLAHPFDWFGRGIDPKRLREKADAIETLNANAFPFKMSKRRAEQAAVSLHLPMTGGSDSHLPQTVGDAYTELDVDKRNVDEIISSILSGRTRPAGGPTSPMNKMRKLSYQLVKFTQDHGYPSILNKAR